MELGIDASSYDTCARTNWTRTLNAGVRFATIRAATTDRKIIPTIDPMYYTNIAATRNNGIGRISYQWYDPRAKMQPQADLFSSVISNDSNAEMIDLEDTVTIKARRSTPVDVLQWLEILTARRGRKPIIYANDDYIKSYLTPYPEFSQYPLIIANWFVRAPYVPLPFTPDWLGWQYCNNANGSYYGFDLPDFSVKGVALCVLKEGVHYGEG